MNWQDRAGRRISLRHLHTLLAVVQCGSIAKAAAALSVSHPVVSKTISDLEHVLGVKVIERGRHGVEPTIYGRACLDCGTAVFDDLRQGIQRINSLSDPATGEVRVGAADPMMQDVIPTIVERIARKYPKMRFCLKSGYADELHNMLRERQVDLVITRRFARLEGDLLSAPFITEKLFVVCGDKSPWARRRVVKLADLLDCPWVLPDDDNIIAPFIAGAFRAAGFDPPKAKVVANALDVRARLAASGDFLTIVPGSTLYRSSGRHPLKKLPLLGSINSTPTEIVTLKNRTPAPAAILFIEYLRSSAKAMGKAIAAADTAG